MIQFRDSSNSHPLNNGRSSFENLGSEEMHSLIVQTLSDETSYEQALQLANEAKLHRKYCDSKLNDQYPCLNYIRELRWIASDELKLAIQDQAFDPSILSNLLLDPDVLPVAKKMLEGGKEAFKQDLDQIMKLNQLLCWDWLRDNICNGNINQYGKHVAGYRANMPLAELIIENSPDAARQAARAKWRIPNAMVAESFVDEF